MTLEEIAAILDARALCGESLIPGINIPKAYASDLMSDVLALCQPGAILITGLTNIQIVRTAQMLDIPAILFVRGKKPMAETIALADESGIPILSTNMGMFQSSGILYAQGVKPCLRPDAGS